jgi:hypothetical protein
MSPDGSLLALRRPGSGTWLVGIGPGTTARLRHVDATLAALGWTDPGTLLGLAGSGGATALVQVSAAGDARFPVTPSPPGASLGTVSLSSSGRLFAFLAPDPVGVAQVDAESIQGSVPLRITAFSHGGLEAASVVLS